MKKAFKMAKKKKKEKGKLSFGVRHDADDYVHKCGLGCALAARHVYV